jgi:hypothetical protein
MEIPTQDEPVVNGRTSTAEEMHDSATLSASASDNNEQNPNIVTTKSLHKNSEDCQQITMEYVNQHKP